MIMSWAKKIILLFLLNILIAFPSLASERLKGLHIKEQAAKYFSDQGLNLSLLVSDKRTFFYLFLISLYPFLNLIWSYPLLVNQDSDVIHDAVYVHN